MGGESPMCPRCALSGVLGETPPAEGAEERLGRFELREKLGEGGAGEVWRAWDPQMRRIVALKRLRAVAPEEAGDLREEAALAARLNHPNIAAVYEVGEAGGRPFIVMPFIAGPTLRAFAEDPKVRGDRRLLVRLVRDAARAVACAHEHGIIHRDLKPENLMVEREPGSADWRVFVTDFGLARRTTPDGWVSQTAPMGTPSYIAPEQARGEHVDPRSDVYALGATLYTLLAGRPPFLAPTPLRVMEMHAETPPPPLRTLVPGLPRDLETIVLKCLEKPPGERYAGAGALAADLDAWLDDRPIAARPPGPLRRTSRFAARHRGAVAAAALGLVALAASSVPLAARARRAERTADLWTQVSVILADAEALARAAETDRARSRLDEGIALCDRSLASGDLPHARYFLGRLWRARGDRPRARAALDAAIAADPGLGEARLERGLLLLEDYADALETAHQTLGTRVSSAAQDRPPFAWEIEKHRPDLARLRQAALDDLAARAGRSPYFRPADAAYGAGAFAHARWDFGTARQSLEEALRLDPLHVPALLALARLSLDEEKRDRALALCDRALALHHANARAHALRAFVSLQTAWTLPGTDRSRTLRAQAAADAERAIALGANSAAMHDLRGLTRRDTGHLAEAAEDFTEALRLNPAFSRAASNRAAVRWSQGDPAAAHADYDLALRLDPDNAWALYDRGLLRRAQRDLDGSVADLTAVMRVMPPWMEPYYERGETLRLQGKLDEAVRDFEYPMDHGYAWMWQCWRGRGLVKLARGDKAGGVADLKKALELMPVGEAGKAEIEVLLQKDASSILK